MRIGIIGAGNVGTGLGRRLVAAGHEAVVSFSRTEAGLAEAAAAIGGRAAGVAEAAAAADVVLLATPWAVTLDTVRRHADVLAGKTVWDCTNPLKPDFSGLEVGTTTSGGEQVAAAAPGARVAKAIPPFAEILHSERMEVDGRRPGVFVCCDDEQAAGVVAGLVRDVGADPCVAGPLALARCTEPLGLLLVQLAYVRGLGARIAAPLLRDAA